LEQLNRDIEQASHQGVNVCFPLSCENERVVRVPAKEAKLLNSREKAPFMICIEVLSNNPVEEPGPDTFGGVTGLHGVSSDPNIQALTGIKTGVQTDQRVGAGHLPGGKVALCLKASCCCRLNNLEN
jgi:hypothetical protein